MTYQSVNPATGETVKTYPSHDQQKIDQTLENAQALYKSDWSKHDNLEKRTAVLAKFADLLIEQQDQIATTMATEMGKLLAQGKSEVELCANIARYFSNKAAEFLAPVKYPTDLGEAWVEHHALGLIMAAEPWNFPFYQLIRVFAPNYAIGNPVILKHASIVPQCAELFEKLIKDAGAPDGAFTNLLAEGIIAALLARVAFAVVSKFNFLAEYRSKIQFCSTPFFTNSFLLLIIPSPSNGLDVIPLGNNGSSIMLISVLKI